MDEELLAAVEEQRYTEVKRELEKKLKRSPESIFYKALRAYVRLCTGQTTSARKDAEELAKMTTTDTRVLKILRDMFSRLGEPEQTIQIYEAVIQKYRLPNVIETLYDDSFLAFDTEWMTRAAKLLYKHFDLTKYAQKLAMCVHISSSSEDDIREAVKALKKHNLVENPHDVYLLTQLQMKTLEFEEVVRILLSFPQKNLVLTLTYLDALRQSKSWQKLFDECSLLIFKQKFDDYDTWKLLIFSAHELSMPKDEVEALVTQGTRNGLLARIHLDKMYGTCALESIKKYYTHYKAKPCCFSDLSAFELPKEFVDMLAQERNELHKKATFSDEEVSVLTNLELFTNNRDNTSIDWAMFQTKEPYKFLDVYIPHLVQSYPPLSIPEILSKTLHLQAFAEKNPENFMIRSWLLNLYSDLGIPTLARTTYHDYLKIKMMQHDTLSYKLLLTPSPDNLQFLVNIYRFYITTDAETNHYLKKGNSECLWTNLRDLYQFGMRFKFSVSRHLLVVQILRMSRFLQESTYHDYFMNDLKCNKWLYLADDLALHDNRDFTSDYNLRFKTAATDVYSAERKQWAKYVQLHYAVQLIMYASDQGEFYKIVELFDKWLAQDAYRSTLQPFELRLFEIYLAIFKIAQANGAQRKKLLDFVTKELKFQTLLLSLILDISPISKEFATIIFGLAELATLEFWRVVQEKRLKAPLAAFKKQLQDYLKSRPQLKEFQKLRADIDTSGLDEEFACARLDSLEKSIEKCYYNTGV
ncbi:hypothetical protein METBISCDRAFT_15691 [Metschnikowia bicuspidata]|uniref:Uncharacterized protein n=1 Tax=Metschnikowia bicuspidata TaxID=27322 RepID=A0A4P9ZFI2_9ASCO|nr:hypothetical protein METBISCDRAFT_15691 [Metschnikowia bicuspidata]